jgi:uncharacterized membrane protein SpoIIM required for sporulation
MNEVAGEAVSFFARYGTTLIAYRLIPFSVLIIGFFPITISLVVALESFVGEKERGTIEPLLSAPLENWQLYFGKLLAGTATPLVASYASIGIYLGMVAGRHLQLPGAYTLALLLMLTTAHAVLMVSAAIVISVQSTSVRAANLLASFIVIPVAIMMQGESVLLFWGTDQVLWLAVGGVVIIAGLLVRLGLAHFQREYLLGRELDTLSFRWMWDLFWNAFRGGSSSLLGWYRVEIAGVIRRLAVPLLIAAAIAVAVNWISYDWVVANVPRLLPGATAGKMKTLMSGAGQYIGLARTIGSLSATHIFANNLRAISLLFLAGMLSFGVLGVAAYLINVSLVGGVLGVLKLLGLSPLLFFEAGLLPHGFFEIPALVLASAAVLRAGAAIVTPQTGKSMGQVLLELTADSAKVFIGIVVPLLVLAALIEAYLTPLILETVLR